MYSCVSGRRLANTHRTKE